MVRHQNVDDPCIWAWEIRTYQGKIQFKHSQKCLYMETQQNLTELGISPNTWHHVAIVYNRSAEDASKIYIDGV